ncbi:hypothetical protein TOPH_08177 [Tolypocladium ophioglossoides CBS 100239]|uniref:Uncharacterized protein n=1 Tax=Tolypocladium ophioglossoides (strain CBS 100239) TaxID=1163406 RepID=A0A0L0MZM0_TOLOC|nr:hypothetical protein TOPH_08177 [Tolypocladium ophioglossoides CBS 100239]
MGRTRVSQPRPVRKQTTLAPTLFKNSATTSPAPRASTSARQKTKGRAPITTVASDRMETDVLLAIQRVHLANILTERKNHE